MPPRVPAEEPDFIEDGGQQIDPELAEIIGNQLDLNVHFWMMVTETYGDLGIIERLVREFRERPEENNTVVRVLLTGIRYFYEHPQLVLFLHHVIGDGGVHTIVIEQFGNRQDMRYVILPERVVAPVPRNADGTPRQMIGRR